MARFVLAAAAALLGGAMLGLGFVLFEGFVPSGVTSFAFYLIFGSLCWIVAQLFGEALYAIVVPSAIRDWHKVLRGICLTIIFCPMTASAFFILTKFPT
jgi:hypothetical protein